jgi:hypothetical protein
VTVLFSAVFVPDMPPTICPPTVPPEIVTLLPVASPEVVLPP